MNTVQKAQKASGVAVTDISAIIGLSVPTTYKRLKNPGSLSIDDFFKIYGEYDDVSRDVMWAYLEERRNFLCARM